jgi:hypothetical protein
MFGYKQREIETFRDQLMECPQLIKQLKECGSGNLAEKGFDELIDEINEIIHDYSDVVEELEALGAYDDPFNIMIMSFSGILFWVQANEFDDAGYFSTKDEALDYASDNFEPFFTALREHEEENDD